MKDVNVMLYPGFEFTQEHLEKLESLRCKEAYPEVYGDKVPGGLKYLRTEIVSIEDIDTNNKYFMQSVRAGKNPAYDDISESIKTKGYSLAELPISVMEDSKGDKPYSAREGRTRYDVMGVGIGVKNLPVDIYGEADEGSSLEFSFAQNCNKKPYGAATYEDAQVYIENMVKCGVIDVVNLSAEEIYAEIRSKLSVMGRRLKPTQLNTIVNDAMGVASGKRLFTSFPKPAYAKAWLNDHGYFDSDDVVYEPVASDHYKFYERIFRFNKKHPGKEVRMVIYSGTLDAKRPSEDWTYRNLDIKKRWNDYRTQIGNFSFGGASYKEGKVFAYGTIPQAEALKDRYPLNKVVVYGDLNE